MAQLRHLSLTIQDKLQLTARSCQETGGDASRYVGGQVLRRDYGVEADMWSLGVMLYILLSGLPPFWGDKEEDIFRMVLKVGCHLSHPHSFRQAQ